MKRALAVSVAVHGLFLLFAALKPPRVLPAADQPLEVAIIEVAAAPKEAPPLPEPKPEPPPPPKPAPTPKERPQVVAMRPPPAPERVEPPEPPEAAEPQAPPSDMPRLDAPMRVPGIGLGGNGLALPSAMLELDAGMIVQEMPRPKRGLHAPEIPKDLVGSTAKEALGRGRVARGMVHPYYVSLGKVLIKQWDADRAVSSKGLKGFVDQAIENNKIWNGIWQEKAQAYAKSGSPFSTQDMPNMPQAPVNPNLMPYGGNPIDQQARRELQKQMNEQFRMTRRATVRVVQDREGKLTKVELVEPSNDEHVDQEALTDIQAAAAKLPAPPPEALEGKQELSSLWSFELIVSITPPVPTFTFEFDEVIGFIDARMPLDRRIYKKVKLVSVE
ncbi:MAG: TonB C-terminal domain-containing protein [Myxococcaceae bacterium]|nr:TonB C-terminal domain-containing protein [Myxococcaceae bacterium]